jgi:RNA polymerase sigma-70 factor (ECF subfamily)
MNLEQEIINYIPELNKYSKYLTSYYPNDLVQDTLEKALRKKNEYNDQGKLIKWLIVIMKNTLIDREKYKKEFYPIFDYFDEFENIKSLKIDRRKLRNVIFNSKRKIVESIYLKSFFELEYKEISVFLDKNIGKVRRNVHEFRTYMNKNFKMEDFIL